MVPPVILLVDDEFDLLQVLAEAVRLRLPKYDVVEATSIEQAEEALSNLNATRTPLALMVVDHRMGERTGLEFIQQAQRRYPDVPTMMYTGQASSGIEAQAQAAGVKVLWKPVKLMELIHEIETLVGP
ncbi:MAG: response regulator [Proteobacteria bacterium]|jgi:CheY-like chemotaxis protein|nr:response regulator [Pseudomonadota bacterium]